MPTPPKPVNVIKLEGKSHRTKREMAERAKAEEKLLTGKVLKERKEVKENEAAHKEFVRLQKLLKNIEKNDDLYSATINRYCLMQAECLEFVEKRELMYQQMIDLEEDKGNFRKNDDLTTYYKLQAQMQKNLLRQRVQKQMLTNHQAQICQQRRRQRKLQKQQKQLQQSLLRRPR